MLEQLGQDYVRTAKAKGLPRRLLLFKHPLRKALILVITLIGVMTGILPGGAVVITVVYSMPGDGHLFGTDAFGRDVLSRVIHGTPLLLLVGLMVVAATGIMGTAIGTMIGTMIGNVRRLDGPEKRLMDGLGLSRHSAGDRTGCGAWSFGGERRAGADHHLYVPHRADRAGERAGRARHALCRSRSRL